MSVQFQSGTLATPSSTVDVASDTIGGIDYQRIKVVWGTTGTATELTTTAGLPVQITAQSSNLAVDVQTLPSVTLSSGTQTIGTVLGSFSVSSSTINIGAVQQGTNPWLSSVSGQMGWLSSSTSTLALPVIGQVAQATSPWNVQNIANPIGWLSSSTSTSITTPPIIGSVAPSSQWIVTTTPSSIISVNQGTNPWISSITSSTLVIGSVAPSSQWTVTTVPTSSNIVIGAVNQGSAWSVSLTSGALVIGAVNQGTSPWTVAQTSSTGFLGSVAVTSGTVTLTSGTLALGTVALSSGTQTIGSVIQTSGTLNLGRMEDAVSSVMMSSGVVTQPVQVNVTTSSSFQLIFTSTTATQTNRIVAAALSVSSSTAAIFGAQFMTSAAVALSGKFFQPVSPSNTVILPFNPMGWAQTTTTAIYYQTGVLVSTAVSVSVTYVPL